MFASRLKRILFISASAVLGLPFIFYLFLRLGGATPLVNFGLKKELGSLFNGEVRFGSFRTDLFSFAEINDLLVLTKHGDAKIPVLTAGRIRLNYDGWQLLRGRRVLEDAIELLSIRGLRLFLLRDDKGRWNLREVLKLPGGGQRKKKTPSNEPRSKLPALATRLVLEDSVIVFNDERRGFQSTVENVEGTLDARAFPLVAFSLSGRTEDKEKDNLSIAGEWNADESSIYARADLDVVPLKTYLNYALPAGGLQFLDGDASLSVRVRDSGEASDLEFSGRANVHNGSLAIPGITDPLNKFKGELLFGDNRLQVNGVQADFLGSTWQVQGELSGLKSPVLNLVLENSSVALSPLSQQIHGLKALSLSGTASLSLTMTGRVVDPQVSGVLSAPSMEIAGITLEMVRAELGLTKRGLKVPALSGKLWAGNVLASAELGFPNKKTGLSQGSIAVSLKGSGVDLGLIRYKGIEYLPVTGTARLDASVEGALIHPKINAKLSCPAAFFSGHPMGALELGALIEGKSLTLNLLTWRGKLNANVGFNFGVQAEFADSKVRLNNFPVDELMRAIAESHDTALIGPALRGKMTLQAQRYVGNADVELGLSGPIRTPDLSLRILRHTGHLLVSRGLWKSKDPKGLAFNAAGLIRLGVDGLKLGDGKAPFVVSVPGAHSAELKLLGRLAVRASQTPDKDGLTVQLSADMGVMDNLEVFEKTRGTAAMDLRLLGRLDSLSVDGWVQIKDLNSSMNSYFSKLKNGELDAWVSDKAVTIENLSFESGGLLEAAGKLDFSGGSRPQGMIEARTDSENGLNVGDFNYGNLKVVLDPLRLDFKGQDGLLVSGRAKMHDSVVTLGQPKEAVQGPSNAPAQPYPVEFDLKAGLDDNVWLKKVQSGVELSLDPFVMLQQTLNSAIETLQNPGFEFLFKPTENDFIIRGKPPLLKIVGELGIDRGTLTFMENEFKIQQADRANKIKFGGLDRLRADIDASAVAQIRYVRELPGGKVEPKNVRVTVIIEPFSEEELVEAHLENSLLNYHLSKFSSDPPLSSNAVEDRAAILSLLVLGDPLNQATRDELGNAPSSSASSSSNDGTRLLTIQASRMLSGVMRKTINRYAKFLGTQTFDYIRVAPRLRYQGASASANNGPGSSQNAGVSQQIQQEGFRVSWLLELGRNIGKNMFVSGQLVRFSEDDVNAVRYQSSSQVDTDVRPLGARLAAEYRLAPTRVLEASWGYSVDENLDPVPFTPKTVDDSKPWYLGVRNTLPTDTYSPRIARQRHQAAIDSKEQQE